MAKQRAAQSDDVYNADKAVRDFGKNHPKDLSEDEHKTLRKLLDNRARAMSDALGVEIHSICEDE